MDRNLISLGITLGFHCNYQCDHCATNSSPQNSIALEAHELALLKREIKKHSPKEIIFSGGEPFFYIDTINDLLYSHPNLNLCKSTILTNGFFATSNKGTAKAMSKISKIDKVNLSLDIFHVKFWKTNQAVNLSRYCKENNIDFTISISLSTPMDLIVLSSYLDQINCNLIHSKVNSCGRAKETSSAFKYSYFEKEVLEKKCPALDQITYICGKGFSNCCSKLIFDNKKDSLIHSVYSNSIEQYLNSSFYKLLNQHSFGELLSKSSKNEKNLKNEHSSVCNLCNYIFLKD
jgi:MoaA/NifB/PqqE/SkfB family radical SAM enzyme